MFKAPLYPDLIEGVQIYDVIMAMTACVIDYNGDHHLWFIYMYTFFLTGIILLIGKFLLLHVLAHVDHAGHLHGHSTMKFILGYCALQ